MAYLARGSRVYVDGVRVNNVLRFNIAEGWIECIVTSPSRYCNQDIGPNDVLTSRLYGHIEIEEGK